MAAVRSWVPSSGRSAAGGGRSSGPQHNQSGGCAGDPCAGPSGPGLHLEGGCAGSSEAPRAHRACSHRLRGKAMG